MPDSDRITELEIALAHQERLCEELSDIVRAQADRLDLVEHRTALLLARLAAFERGEEPPPAADVRPPHW